MTLAERSAAYPAGFFMQVLCARIHGSAAKIKALRGGKILPAMQAKFYKLILFSSEPMFSA